MTESIVILKVEKILKKYPIYRGIFKRIIGWTNILKEVSFDVYSGEVLAIIGESGCGKSTLARIISNLEKPTKGEVFYKETNIRKVGKKEILRLRKKIQIVFQDPGSALNDNFTIEQILKEPLDIHKIGSKQEKQKLIENVMQQVELPVEFLQRYQHELSGGQRQRLLIARSIILKPDLLILDEPLSALDVSLQKQMIELFKKLQKELGLTIIIISHNLRLVRSFSDRVLILHFGEVAELRNTQELFENPEHNYTKELLASIPNKTGKTRF